MSQGCNLGWSHHLKIFASFSGGCWQCLSLSPSQKEYLRDSLLLSWPHGSRSWILEVLNACGSPASHRHAVSVQKTRIQQLLIRRI